MFGRQRHDDPPVSLYDHVRAHVPERGPGLLDGGETLPDEGDEGDGDGLVWAPGARDGMLTHHWAGKADPGEVERVSAALLTALRDRKGRDGGDAALYEAARQVSVVSLVGDVLDRVVAAGVDAERCYRTGYRLATEGRHREPVKLGIALLGLFDAAHHRDELMILGRHDEFTLFAAVALANREGGAEQDLWELARSVRGWGRVHLVERLAGTADPGLRDWILREGFRNEVMDAYLAGTAAETGGLAEALAGGAAGGPDDELLYAAGDILSALCDEGGPMEGITAYADGERAAGLFLGHMAARASDLRHFLAVHAVRGHAERAWPDLAERCAEILGRPVWPERARRDLAADDPARFHRAVHACGILGVPTLRAHLDRLRTRDPFVQDDWYGAVTQAGPDEIDEVIALASELLPLDAVAAGPARKAGSGEAFTPHRCLDMLLQGLVAWPGRGTPLVLAGLASPVVRNRNMAVRTLDAWGEAAWPPGTRDALTTALAREPDDGVRGRLQALLEDRPVD